MHHHAQLALEISYTVQAREVPSSFSDISAFLFSFDKPTLCLLPSTAFSVNRVPEKLDAVVIGSGIGGLASAAILAKAGKRVLVLEQHNKAGGCCHTFGENGLEFDTGKAYLEKGWDHGSVFRRLGMGTVE